MGQLLHHELTGEGPQVVTLLHGIGAHLGTWSRQVDALATRYRVLNVDLRGHGGSPTPEGEWTLADLARDLDLLLEELSIPRTHLVGHSGGGVVAMQFASSYPERVDALALVSTASECNQVAAAWYESLAAISEQDGARAALERVCGDLGVVPPGGEQVLPDSLGFARVARCMAQIHRQPLTPRLAAIDGPALVIVGSADVIGVGGSVIIHRNMPGSRLEVVEGRGHGIHLEDPEGFNALLLGFLDSTREVT